MMTTYFWDDDEPWTIDVILGLIVLTCLMVMISIVVIPCVIFWSWVTHKPETHFKRNAPYTGALILGLGLSFMLIPDPPVALNWIRWILYGAGATLALSTVYACRDNELRAAPLVMVCGLLVATGNHFLYQHHIIAGETAYLLGVLIGFYLIYAPWALLYFGNQPKPKPITIP